MGWLHFENFRCVKKTEKEPEEKPESGVPLGEDDKIVYEELEVLEDQKYES